MTFKILSISAIHLLHVRPANVRQRSRKGITNVKYHEEPVKIFKYGGINERDIAQRNAIDFVHSCPEHRAGKSHGNST